MSFQCIIVSAVQDRVLSFRYVLLNKMIKDNSNVGYRTVISRVRIKELYDYLSIPISFKSSLTVPFLIVFGTKGPRLHYAGEFLKRRFHSENASNVFRPHYAEGISKRDNHRSF